MGSVFSRRCVDYYYYCSFSFFSKLSKKLFRLKNVQKKTDGEDESLYISRRMVIIILYKIIQKGFLSRHWKIVVQIIAKQTAPKLCTEAWEKYVIRKLISHHDVESLTMLYKLLLMIIQRTIHTTLFCKNQQ